VSADTSPSEASTPLRCCCAPFAIMACISVPSTRLSISSGLDSHATNCVGVGPNVSSWRPGAGEGRPRTKTPLYGPLSSLASTRQMQSFMEKIGPQDRVPLVGDTRQHQGVDAGKPFKQMQQAGMQTSQLDRIMRQKDPELLRVVEHFAKNETATGVSLLQQQGRVTEIPDSAQRIEAIAKDYAAKPENTLVVSPDNASRRAINDAIRNELKGSGIVSKDDHRMEVLTQRSELTSVDREWAANYQEGDILYYSRGSKEHGIEPRSYVTVASIDAEANRITVAQDDGKQVTYNPERLSGITAYRASQDARIYTNDAGTLGERLSTDVTKTSA